MSYIRKFTAGSPEDMRLTEAAAMMTDRSPNHWRYLVSVTYFDFTDWSSGSSWGIAGGKSAELSSGATLEITGIAPGATGKWTLLSGFGRISDNGWKTGDIMVAGFDEEHYTKRAYRDGNDYVLVISEGHL